MENKVFIKFQLNFYFPFKFSFIVVVIIKTCNIIHLLYTSLICIKLSLSEIESKIRWGIWYLWNPAIKQYYFYMMSFVFQFSIKFLIFFFLLFSSFSVVVFVYCYTRISIQYCWVQKLSMSIFYNASWHSLSFGMKGYIIYSDSNKK